MRTDLGSRSNEAARKYANIPETSGYSSASKKERAEFESARLQYDNVRRNIFQLASAKQGDFASASEFMLNHDSQIQMQRVFASYPQLETALTNIERIEGQSRGKVAARSAIREFGWKGGIAGLSSLARYKSMSVLAFSATEAAIGVGAIVNSARETFRARTKAREELIAAQQNLTRKEAAALKLKKGRKWLGLGKKEHQRLAGHAFRKTTFIDADNYNERIQKLLERINDPANEKNAMNQRQLHRLVNMAEAHLTEGLVNFGKGGTRLASAYEFSTNLAQARVELARRNWTNQKNTIPNLAYFDAKGNPQEISLPAFMKAKQLRMSKEETKFILRGFMRGLAVGAVAGGVGAAFGGWIKERFGDDIRQWIGSAQEQFGGSGGKTNEIVEQVDESLRNAKLAGARAEAAASMTEAEFAAHKAEATARISGEHLKPTPPENLPVGKSVNISRLKTSHPIDMESSRPLPKAYSKTPTPKIKSGLEAALESESEAVKKLRMDMEKSVIYPKVETTPKPAKGGLEAILESESPEVKKLREAMEKGSAVFPHSGENAPKLAEAIPSPLESNPEYTDLAKIKRGEGMWHAVRRQLNYQKSHTSPEEFASRYGISVEDLNRHPKKSIERIAGNLLVDQKHIIPNSKGGILSETRLRKGASVFVGEDGKIEITDKGKFTYEWQKPAATTAVEPLTQPSGVVETATTPVGEASPTIAVPEKISISTPERLLSQAENTARKISGLNLDNYAKVRDASLTEFLKKPPRGKGFHVLAEMLRRAKPSKIDMQESISEFLTKHFGE